MSKGAGSLATIMLYLPHDPRTKWIHQNNFRPHWQAQLNEIDLPSLPTSCSASKASWANLFCLIKPGNTAEKKFGGSILVKYHVVGKT